MNPEVFPYPWTPRDVYGARYTLFPGYTDGLFQEIDGAAPVLTPAMSDGSPVGTIVSPIDGHVTTVINGASNAVRPTLLSDSTGSGNQRRNSFLRFGASSQISALYVENSTGAFRSIHTTQGYTIAFWLRMQTGGSVGGDGVAQFIMDSQGGSGGVPGFLFYRSSSNQLLFSSNSGSAWLAQLTSSSSIASTTGWVAVVVQCTGAGGTCTMSFNGTTVASESVGAGAALGTNAEYSLNIGQTATGSGAGRGQFDIDNLLIADCVISASDLNNWLNFNPPRTSHSLLRVTREAAELNPSDFSHCWAWWDFSTPVDPITGQPFLYTSATPTTGVANTGDLIGYAENRGGARLLRFLSQSTSGQVPSWKPGQQNGCPAAYLNGFWNSGTSTSEPQSFQLNQITPSVQKTWYFVCQQNWTGGSGGLGTGGSRLHNYSGTTAVYCAISGVNYTGHPAGFAEHLSGDTGTVPTVSNYPQLTVTGAAAGTYSYAGDYSGGASYYCAAASKYLWYNESTYTISTTLGTASGAYWTIGTSSPLGSYTAQGSASGTPVVSGGSFNGPSGWNVYHGQQSGNQIRLGVDGYWGPWFTTTGTFLWDNIGNDSQQNGYSNTYPATTHWEYNGYIGEGAVFLYSLPQHRFSQILRRLQDKWAIPSMYIGN